MAATGDGGEKFGPGAGARGVPVLSLCGPDSQLTWSGASVDRLAVTVTGPEYSESRELLTFDSADEAAAGLVKIRESIDGCDEMPGDTRENDRFLTVLPVDAGYDSATFGITYRVGTGGAVWQFVRVGNAVLATSASGEYTPETIEAGDDRGRRRRPQRGQQAGHLGDVHLHRRRLLS